MVGVLGLVGWPRLKITSIHYDLIRLRAEVDAELEALLRAGKRDPRQAVTTDLAFAAGPRLNAAGGT